ncbi:hypothetical protein [Streptomyces fradiae]|uniref:hypothetical protein n=1 Tax=Streptomyces fradiae TaxID=1906 RepID=UPI00398793D0
MEPHVEVRQTLRRAASGGGGHLLDKPFEVVEQLRRAAVGDVAEGEALDGQPDRDQDLSDFALRDAGDFRPSIGVRRLPGPADDADPAALSSPESWWSGLPEQMWGRVAVVAL